MMGLVGEKERKAEMNKGGAELKKDEDEFPDIGTKLQLFMLKREKRKLQKRITKLEAENVRLQNRVRVLKKSESKS